MPAGLRPLLVPAKRGRDRALRRAGLVVVALAVTLATGALAFLLDDQLGDAPLFLLVVPMALSAFAYGRRGGLVFTTVGSCLATVWWVAHDRYEGTGWFVSRIATYVLLGIVLGWLVDQRRALERELEQHAELSPDLIATANYEGVFTRVNPAFSRTLGYTEEELTSRPYLDFVHPDDRAATLAEAARQTEAGEAVIHFRNRYVCKDGSYRWLEWSSSPVPETRSLVAIARDVTERQELEERERRRQEELEQAVRDRTAELRQRNEELEDARREILQRLALAAEYRDDDTFAHTERVGRAAALLAQELGLPDDEVALVREAAPLHDVGKLGVSDAVLLKPGTLTAEERAQMERHAAAGAALLSGSSSDVLRVAEVIAKHHHEWWDGTGYPNGLRGEAIPLVARIVAVVDVFDALTHVRPYKGAWSVEQARDELRALAGRQFDPDVVDAFDRLDLHALSGMPDEAPPTGDGRALALARHAPWSSRG